MNHWHNEVSERFIAFFSGAFTGGTIGSALLGISWTSLIIETPLKILMAVVVSFMGGIAGLAGRDFYNGFLKDKFKKK